MKTVRIRKFSVVCFYSGSKKPIILEVQLGGTEVSESNLVQFTHPELDPFKGRY